MAGISSKAAGGLENRFKYNGKEEQRQEFSDGSGLEWQDYGARMYDVQIGNWNCMDPMGEKYTSISLYTFVLNNPILLVDPNGMEVINAWHKDRIKKEETLVEILKVVNDQKATQEDREFAAKVAESITSEIAEITRNLVRTYEVLADLQATDPELFNKINNLKDADGNYVDVYVKTVDNFGETTGDPGVFGKSTLEVSKSHPNKPTSIYDQFSPGSGTVLVEINSRKYDSEDAVVLTAHEFGHIKYNVPNLASYSKYFRDNYNTSTPGEKGHRRNDPSGKSVDEVLKKFLPLYKKYKKTKN